MCRIQIGWKGGYDHLQESPCLPLISAVGHNGIAINDKSEMNISSMINDKSPTLLSV